MIEQRRQRAEKRAYKERQAAPGVRPKHAFIGALAGHLKGRIADVPRARSNGMVAPKHEVAALRPASRGA